MRISDWSSDVCSSDLPLEFGGIAGGKVDGRALGSAAGGEQHAAVLDRRQLRLEAHEEEVARPGHRQRDDDHQRAHAQGRLERAAIAAVQGIEATLERSEEHTSELQSLMRISYAVFCLKKKKI